MLAQCGKPTSPYNIEISNKAFDTLFTEFKSQTKYYSHQNLDSLAIAVDIKDDTTVTLYANNELRPDYYLGVASYDSIDIKFYSNRPEGVNGFFNFLYKGTKPQKKEIKDLSSCGLTYNRSYKYSRGKFYLR